jgi:hypothetical protein
MSISTLDTIFPAGWLANSSLIRPAAGPIA